MKRFRVPRKTPNVLKAQWGKLAGDNPDLVYTWGDGVDRCDARLLHHHFTSKSRSPFKDANGLPKLDPSLWEELETRGYDMTTFKFSIRKKTV